MSQLLHIHRLRAAPHELNYHDPGTEYPSGWIVRFGGDDDAFWDLVRALKWDGCRWNPHAFGKKRGGWLVSHHTLLRLSHRFENWQQCIEREQERQRVEQRRRDLAAVEQIRRELGITRDINACPF